LIKIHGLGKDFKGTGDSVVQALQAIDLEVRRGEFFVLLGPSGSGKTTLLRCVAGLTVPDRGEIVLDGVTVYSQAKRTLVPPELRGLGMVFQSYAIWPHMSVFENVALPLCQRKRKLSKAEVRKRVHWALSLVGLEHMGQRPAPLLSGGQQQRVALARALATQPSILLMDEPLSNLDARLREEVRKEVRSLVTQLGITVLYVTHDQMEAMELADRVGVMQDGNLLQQGSPEELYRFPAEPRVAQFFGSTNWIDGIMEAPSMVQSAIGYLEVDDSRVGSKKGPVVVAARPEDIQLTAPPPGDQAGNNRFSGQIVAGVFFGDHRLYTVAINDQRLLVKTLTAVELPKDVYVSIPRDRLCAFPKEAALKGVVIPQ
jgi:iron(III) transport system ATP-binding protein